MPTLLLIVAMQGRLDEARNLIVREPGSDPGARDGLHVRNLVERLSRYGWRRLAGEPSLPSGSSRGRSSDRPKLRDSWFYALCSVDLARAVCDQDRPAECLEILDRERSADPRRRTVSSSWSAGQPACPRTGAARAAQERGADRQRGCRPRRGNRVPRLARRCAARPGRGAAPRGQSRGGRGRSGRGHRAVRAQGQRRLRREGAGCARRAWAERRRRSCLRTCWTSGSWGPWRSARGRAGHPRWAAPAGAAGLSADSGRASRSRPTGWSSSSGRTARATLRRRCRWRSPGFARRSVTQP